MTAMREWLDHHSIEPSMFKYAFIPPGIVFHVYFKSEEESGMFAREFGGSVLARFADTSWTGAKDEVGRTVDSSPARRFRERRD
jgi:hypothetical protein